MCLQIGGIRFLYDNLIEDIGRFKDSNGFGCILAHSMGLGFSSRYIVYVIYCIIIYIYINIYKIYISIIYIYIYIYIYYLHQINLYALHSQVKQYNWYLSLTSFYATPRVKMSWSLFP